MEDLLKAWSNFCNGYKYCCDCKLLPICHKAPRDWDSVDCKLLIDLVMGNG